MSRHAEQSKHSQSEVLVTGLDSLLATINPFSALRYNTVDGFGPRQAKEGEAKGTRSRSREDFTQNRKE